MRFFSLKNCIVFIATIYIVSNLSVRAQTVDRTRSTGQAPTDIEQWTVEKIDDNIFKLGLITIDKSNDSIYFPVKLNQREGLIELLLCTDWGRTHESVFTTKVYPIYLQTAMLLAGFKYGAPVSIAGDNNIPTGDLVEIYVAWGDDLSDKVRIEDLAYDQPKEKSMEHVDWIYTGSQFVNGLFYAQEEGSIITTYRDPNTMFDNPLPEGADDTVYYVNTKLIGQLPENLTIIFKKPYTPVEGDNQ